MHEKLEARNEHKNHTLHRTKYKLQNLKLDKESINKNAHLHNITQNIKYKFFIA